MFGMWIWWLVAAFAFAAAISAVLRVPAQRSELPGESAETLLKKRYASGQLNEHEYNELMKVLRK